MSTLTQVVVTPEGTTERPLVGVTKDVIVSTDLCAEEPIPSHASVEHGIGCTMISSATTGKAARIIASTHEFPDDPMNALKVVQSIEPRSKAYTVRIKLFLDDAEKHAGMFLGFDRAVPRAKRRTFCISQKNPLDMDAVYRWLDDDE